jgi:hypothetical protein
MNDFYVNVERVFQDWNYGHPKVLYGLIRSMRPKVVVEIGTYRGFGAAWMAKALQENNDGRLYCVDNFSLTDHEARYGDARRHLRENLQQLGVHDFVHVLDGESHKVDLPDRIDFAYIDGWHSYQATKSDFERVAERGAECVCFDDTTQSAGPRMVFDEIRASGQWDVLEIFRDCGMGIAMRRGPKGPITFSQELPPPDKGTILIGMPRPAQLQHFEHAAKVNGLPGYPETILQNLTA